MNMNGILVRKIGSFALESLPVVPPGPGEILVKVEWTGLCRTDLKLIREGHRDLILPRIPGEEADDGSSLEWPQPPESSLDKTACRLLSFPAGRPKGHPGAPYPSGTMNKRLVLLSRSGSHDVR